MKNTDHLIGHSSWFRYWMPYCLKSLEHGIYLPVNRDYKPLGVITDTTVDYEEYAVSHGLKFARDPRTYTDVWHRPESPLYLYNDNPATLSTYFARLERLMARSIKVNNRAAVEAMGRTYK